MKKLIWVFVAGCLLSGCDAFDEQARAQQPKPIEIGSGYKVQIGSELVSISGTSECITDSSLSDCIIITPDTKVVEVLIAFPDRLQREAWTITRTGKQMMLRRGDGSYVIQAK